MALSWRKWKNMRLYLPALIWHLRHQPGYSHFNLTMIMTDQEETELLMKVKGQPWVGQALILSQVKMYCLSPMWWATPSVRTSPSHHNKFKKELWPHLSAFLNNFWSKQSINRAAWWLSHVHENWKPQLSGLSWDKNSQNAWKDPNDSCLQIDPKIFLMLFWYVSFWLNQEIQMLGVGENTTKQFVWQFYKNKREIRSFISQNSCVPTPV